jgi:hypothetical protein
MLKDYASIEHLIKEARIQRSVYIAEILSSAVIATIEAIKIFRNHLLDTKQAMDDSAKNRKSIFTFDA